MIYLGDMEEWRDVVGYEGKYQVSNEGRVKSLERTVESVSHKKPCLRHIQGYVKQLQENSRTGYLEVGLNKDGNRKTLRVHRLVWEAFNGEITEGLEIDHINAIRTDNKLENLRLVTHKDNLNNPLSVVNKIKSLTGKFKGELNPNYGKHFSEESKRKMSFAKQNMSEETRRRYSEAAKKRWKIKKEFFCHNL